MIFKYMKRPFSSRELQVLGQKEPLMPGRPTSTIFNAPVSYRQNALALLCDKSPCFAVTGNDFSALTCGYYQKNLGRGNRLEPEKIDTFGVKWIYEPVAGGSISVGGNPRFTDANDWKNVISMPDINKWDWAADAAEHPVDTNFAVQVTMANGFWFERLISLMDFMNAAIALIDEEQRDALHELFEETTQLACDLVDKICEYWPAVDGFMIHDDWGSQRDPFFSDSTARELFLPHIKKLVSHVHKQGRYCGIHSCGHAEDRVNIFISAGFDTWQMQPNANNIYKLYDEVGDKIVLQVAIPAFDLNDEKAAVQAARDYADTFCKPGKPTMLIPCDAFKSKAFAEEVYTCSRKRYLDQ